jgi:EmrB/QacA subfamily drug resistance transporter
MGGHDETVDRARAPDLPVDWRRRSVLVAAVLGTALAYMSDDMLNLAIPSVARDLEATAAGVQWILNAYYLPLVAFVLVAGSVGDIIGHRRVFTAGLLLFCAGAVLCATAFHVGMLIAGRAVQGVAAAMLLAAGLALVTCANPADRRDRALGQFFGLVAAVPALGPLLSGVLVDWLSWRWLFLAPLVLPLAALAITHGLRETPRAARRPDVRGSLAALVALGGISVALILGPAQTSAMLVVAAAVIGVAAGVWFIRVERRASDPLLPLAFFRRRQFVGANSIWLLGCMTSWGAVFFLAVTLQTTLGLRPVTAGLLLTPIYLVMMVGSPVSGAVAGRLGGRRVIVTGLGVYTVGLWLLSHIHAGSTAPLDVLMPLAVFAAGMAMFTAPLAAATMSALDDEDQGIASGVNNAMGQLAGLLAIIMLPALAGLAGASSLTGAVLAEAYPRALRAAAALAVVGIPVALLTLPGGAPATGSLPGSGPGLSRPARTADRNHAPTAACSLAPCRHPRPGPCCSPSSSMAAEYGVASSLQALVKEP